MIRHLFAAVVVVSATATPAAAQLRTWDGNRGNPPDGTFNVAVNWDSDLVPVASNTALFDLNNDYTVTFTADAVSDSVQVVAGDVSLVSDSATVRLYNLLTRGNWRLNEISSDGLARLIRIGETSHVQ